MVRNAFNGWDFQSHAFVFIAEVGRLVFPSSYDFGEVLLSCCFR